MAGEQDTRTISELFAAATDWNVEDGEGDWYAVSALHGIGTREVMEGAIALIRADDPRFRARGIDILGQLGAPERTFLEECLQTTLSVIRLDSSPRVIDAAAIALGHLGDPRGVPELIRFVDHEHPRIRYAVAFALGGRTEPEAIDALIHLTNDRDELVRYWATFGLCSDIDSPKVREALYRRLNDSDEVTRYEAIRGLMHYGDHRVVSYVIDALRTFSEDNKPRFEAYGFARLDVEGEDLSDEALIGAIERRFSTES